MLVVKEGVLFVVEIEMVVVVVVGVVLVVIVVEVVVVVEVLVVKEAVVKVVVVMYSSSKGMTGSILGNSLDRLGLEGQEYKGQ